MVDLDPANATGFNGRESALVLAMFGIRWEFYGGSLLALC